MEATIYSKPDAKEESFDFSQISLRPSDPSDLDDLMEWCSDEKVTEYCTWEPYTSKQEGIDLINKIPSTFSWYRSIVLDNHAIGSVSAHLQSGRFRGKVAEIGYILKYRFWGKGIATHVVKEASKIIFEEYPELERLEAMTDLENVGSQRVLDKAGFQREGVMRKYLFIKGKSRDVVIYGLLKTDLQT